MRAAQRGLVVLILVGAGALAGWFFGRPALSRWVWTQVSKHVESHFDAFLAVESFEVFFLPSVRVEGRGLTLHKRDRRNEPPLISAQSFSISTTVARLWRGGLRRVALTGLKIAIPPGSRPSLKQPGPESNPASPSVMSGLTVDEIVSTAAFLEIAPNDPGGLPLIFDITYVRLGGFSSAGPAAYEAHLINPKPRGEIVASGRVGPWRADDPRLTFVDGKYSLARADLSVFKGIGGTLDSTGTFTGVLSALNVEGTATMPDFEVSTGGRPMRLDTTFNARVDGTNGNTYLDRVSARLGNSQFEATGEIAGVPGGPGKTIRLNVSTDRARLEDVIGLVVRERPVPMLGQLSLQTRLELPPGDEPVPDVLRLDGRFTIRQGRFASDSVQDKVDELSRRGRGEPKNLEIDNVLSEFGGQFVLRRGVLQLPGLQFSVRGAQVRLAGTYALRGERLGFSGELRLQARLSQTTTGFKSLLLRVVDPFFRKHGAGAVLPIKVTGTVSQPQFGLNLGRGGK